MKTSAVSRSFHTQRNWKIPNDASAGTESGRTMLRKIFQFDAPSTRAASIRSRGSVMKKLRSRKTQNGSAKTVCAIQIPKYHPVIAVFVPVRNSPRSWNSIEDRDERALNRHDHQRDDGEEDRVPEREADPRERVRRHGADQERQERRRDAIRALFRKLELIWLR